MCVVIIALFIFYFIDISTNKKWLGILASIFYTTLPPLFSSLWNLGDTQIIAEPFLLGLLFFFYKSAYRQYNQPRPYRSSFFSLGFLLFFIFAIRSRETNIVVYPTIFVLTILFYRKLLKLFISSSLILVYYTSLGFGDTSFGGYKLQGIFNKLIASPLTDYPPEVFTLFSLKQHFLQVPKALINQLGFFSGWLMVFSLIYLSIYLIQTSLFKKLVRRIRQGYLEKKYFIYIFSIISLILVILSYGFFTDQVEHRYFAVGLAFFTFIIFITFDLTANYLRKSSDKLYSGYLLLFIIFIILAITVNAYHVHIHMRGGTLGYYKGNFDAARFIISKDNQIDYTTQEIVLLLTGHTNFIMSGLKNLTLIPNTLQKAYSIRGGPFQHLHSFNESLVSNKTFYLLNFLNHNPPLQLNQNYSITEIAAFGGCLQDQTIYCKFKNLFIEPYNTLFVYEVKRKVPI